MNLSQMQMFLEVVRRGSLSEAARQHNLTQPAVTRKMQRLEKELRVELFERGEGHQIALTRAGRDFLVFAEKVLADYRALQENWHAQRNDVQGPLRLVASTTPGEFVVPRLLAKFTARYPNVKPTMMIVDSAEVEEKLIAHECDAGFSGKAPEKASLEAHRIMDDEIVLVVPPGHPLVARGQGEVDLAELEGAVFLEREEGSGTMQSVHRILAGHGQSLPPHKTAMALGSTQAIISAVAAGLGIGFVSALATEDTGGRIVPLRLRGLPLKRELYLVFEAGHDQSASLLVREFLSFILNKEASSNPADLPLLDLDDSDEE
ncbi:MAG TPA: LysR family transcriptional regulator [Chloroflexia bacterium]|nr:LysR family transcriptional regulator [Chloroflexia bacterium]